MMVHGGDQDAYGAFFDVLQCLLTVKLVVIACIDWHGMLASARSKDKSSARAFVPEKL